MRTECLSREGLEAPGVLRRSSMCEEMSTGAANLAIRRVSGNLYQLKGARLRRDLDLVVEVFYPADRESGGVHVFPALHDEDRQLSRSFSNLPRGIEVVPDPLFPEEWCAAQAARRGRHETFPQEECTTCPPPLLLDPPPFFQIWLKHSRSLE